MAVRVETKDCHSPRCCLSLREPLLVRLVDAAACAAPAVGFGFPVGLDFAGGFEAVEGGVEGALLEFEQAAASGFEPAEDFQAVGGVALEGGEDEHFEVSAEFVAVDGGHGVIVDRL